jgi:hypothetical protein
MALLEYRGLGISGENRDICIDLIEGMWQPTQIRGRDWIVPKRDGRIYGNRRADTLVVPLAGFIRGDPFLPDLTDRRETFNDNVTAVMAVMDTTLEPGSLIASSGYLGLPAGSTATLECRVRNAAPGKIESYRTSPFQLWTFELEAIDPPEWTFGS